MTSTKEEKGSATVEKLRKCAEYPFAYGASNFVKLLEEAALEIAFCNDVMEAYRSMETALRKIAENDTDGLPMWSGIAMQSFARKALKNE